jgi:hypothetical protein
MTKRSNPKLSKARAEVTARHREQALRAVVLRVAGLSFKRVARELGVAEKRAQQLCQRGVRMLRAQKKSLEPKP